MDKLLKELTVEEFNLNLAGDDGTAPGGGSLSALGGALGAGCLIMVAKLTASLKRFADKAPLCLEIAAEAAPYVQQLTDGIDYDINCYYGIVNAYRLPKSTDEEIAARKAAVAQAMLVATEAPFSVLEKINKLMHLAEKLEGNYNPAAASDFAAALLQLRAGAKSAWHNVLANVGGIKDAEKAEYLRSEGAKLHAECMAMADRMVAAAEASLEG